MKKMLLFLIWFVLLIFLSGSVLAIENEETKADFSNSTFKAIYTNNNVQFYSLEVSNITLPTNSKGKPVEVNVRYTIGNTQPEFSDIYGESYSGKYDAEAKKIIFPRLETALQLKGDVYFWIFQLDETELGTKKTGSLVYSAKVERPIDKKYSELFGTPLIGSNLTYISINTPMENYVTRKAKLKIGEITDNSILSAIKDNDTTNGLDKLLDYSKNSSTIYEGIIEGKPSFVANLHDDLKGKVKSDTYYYIYINFDDENGKYYPVEGVTIGLGIATQQSCQIAFYGNSKFVWNENSDTQVPTNPNEDNKDDEGKNNENNNSENKNDEEKNNENNNNINNNNEEKNNDINKEKDTTTAKVSLPQTGKEKIIVGFIIILSISSITLYFLNKKYNVIK